MTSSPRPARTAAGRATVLLAALLSLRTAWVGARRAGTPSAIAPYRCAVPVELGGRGVTCMEPADAVRLSLVPGDRVDPERVAGGLDPSACRERMEPARLRAFEVPLDPNRAPAAELESIDGIGPNLAARIVAGRPYRGVEELVRVRGIGARRLNALAPRLSVGVEGRWRPRCRGKVSAGRWTTPSSRD